jgi:hypothetical protein
MPYLYVYKEILFLQIFQEASLIFRESLNTSLIAMEQAT